MANKPKLALGLDLYLFAFYDLDTERDRSMAVMPIPWSAFIKYSEYLGLTEDEREDFIYILRQLDNAHLENIKKS